MNRRTEVGWLRNSLFSAAVENALRVARRNPIPARLIVAGAGWFIHDMTTRRPRSTSWRRRINQAEEIPVLNTGHARIYDPDASPLHPTQDSLESRREMSARV